MRLIGIILAAIGTFIFGSFAICVFALPFVALGWSGFLFYLLLAVVMGVIVAPFALIDLYYSRKS